MPLIRGDLPAAEAGVARLRDDGCAGLIGDGENAGDFIGRGGAQHERRAANPDLPPFAHVAIHRRGIADRVLLADDGREPVECAG